MKYFKHILPTTVFVIFISLGACKSDGDRTNDDKSFDDSNLEEATPNTEVSNNMSLQAQEVEDLIRVAVPQAGSEIANPQEIRGEARGTWFFEGDFAVYLLDENDKEIAVAIAIAQSEWMTTDWVSFEATLEFDVESAGNGFLVFEKSNPSDKRELDRELRFPVSFTP